MSRSRLAYGGWLAAGLLLVPFDGGLSAALSTERQGAGKAVVRVAEILRDVLTGPSSLLLLLAILGMERERRGRLLDLLVAFLAAVFAAEVLKFAAGRVRPSPPDYPLVFHWFQGLARGQDWKSFPSGHAARAFAAAACLSSIWPRGLWIWLAFAAAAGCSRILSGLHFPSDVVLGALVGWGIARAILGALAAAPPPAPPPNATEPA